MRSSKIFWLPCQIIKQRKCYSSDQSYSSALRPFYMIVHPDFFSQHPEEKAINEDSLKILHSYLNDLATSKYPSPVRLKFYLRGKEKDDDSISPKKGRELRMVTIQLRSRDLSTSVQQILNLCSLPIEKKRTPSNAVSRDFSYQSKPKDRNIDWESIARSFGKEDFDFAVDMDFSHRSRGRDQIRKTQGDLPGWFLTNIPTARMRMRTAEPIVAENKEIIQRMKETLGLKSFVLQTPVYSHSTLNGALKQLESLFLNKWSVSSILLRKKILTVGNFNGVDHIGRLVFDITDVPSSWTEALSHMIDIDDLAEVLRVPELRISELLNGLKISRDPGSLEVFPIETYYRWVTKLLENLKESQRNGEKITGAYGGLRGQVTKPRMFATVSPEGDILIPCVTSMEILGRFLHKNATLAIEARRNYARAVQKELEISARCRERLGLESLIKDRLITPSQMISGCKRLLECQDDALEGTRIIISNYYGITGDGDVRIPWETSNGNFKRKNAN